MGAGFSPPDMWVLGIGLRSLGLAASPFTSLSHLIGLLFYFFQGKMGIWQRTDGEEGLGGVQEWETWEVLYENIKIIITRKQN